MARLHGVLGGLAAKKMDLPLTPALLARLGDCMVKAFAEEAKKDFAKRGWSGLAEDGSAPIWDSFSYVIRGQKTVEIKSTFPHIEELVDSDTKPYRMTWLTQQAKDENPADFELTERERELRMKRGGRVSRGERLPLVVPLKSANGSVIFRAAPLTFADAWVHPGIARFTFVERAVKEGRARCLEILKIEAVRAILGSYK